MVIDKRPDDYKTAENVPEPIICTGKAIWDVSSVQFVSYSVGNFVEPNNISDTKSNGGEYKAEQAIMHSFFAVITAGNDVHIVTYRRHDNKSVNAESNDR